MAEVWPPITVATPPLPLAGRRWRRSVRREFLGEGALAEGHVRIGAAHGLQMAGQQFGGAAAVAAVHDLKSFRLAGTVTPTWLT